MSRAVALAVALVALAPGVARGSSAWSWPVRGRVVGSFSLSAANPFAAGQRRGIAIAAAPAAAVRSACAGRVAFAGSIGRAGPTLSVACGRLRATYQGLASIAVARGTPVFAGETVATLGGRGVLHLGARVEHARQRYVDPARLLGDRPSVAPPLGPAPRSIARRRMPPPSPAAPHRVRPPARAPDRAPPLAWLGLALLAAAAPISSLSRRRRRRAPTAAFRAWAVRQLR